MLVAGAYWRQSGRMRTSYPDWGSTLDKTACSLRQTVQGERSISTLKHGSCMEAKLGDHILGTLSSMMQAVCWKRQWITVAHVSRNLAPPMRKSDCRYWSISVVATPDRHALLAARAATKPIEAENCPQAPQRPLQFAKSGRTVTFDSCQTD